MKFTINSGDFYRRLATVAKAQASRNSLMILENVLLDMSGNKITLTASDSSISLISSMEVANAEGGGRICLPTSTMTSALKELANQPITLDINNDTYEIAITYNGGKFQLMGLAAEDFPVIPTYDNATAIKAGIIANGISKVVSCTANDELRPIMNGICMDFTPDGLVFVASDGHKLARYQYTEVHDDKLQRYVLPTKTSQILSLIADKQDDDVMVTITERNAQFVTNDYRLISVLQEGTYPKYDTVIPKDNPFATRVNRAALISALRRVLVFASESTSLISLHINAAQMTIAAQNAEFGQSSEELVNCDGNCNDFKIEFKGTFLLELLRIMDSEDIILNLASPQQAVVITPPEQPENERQLLLLMPMMLGEV